MKRKVILSFLVVGLVSVGLINLSFAQNTVIPTAPVVTNTKKVMDAKPREDAVKPVKKHRHHRKSMMKSSKRGMGKKIHKKAEAQESMKNMDTSVQINGTHD